MNKWIVLSLVLICGCGEAAQLPPVADVVAGGVNVSLLSKPGSGARPTLFVFAVSRGDTFNEKFIYNDVGRLLVKRGWLVVTLDLPAHGDDMRAGEGNALVGWRTRMEAGEDLVGDFCTKASAVLTDLIAEKRSKAGDVYVAGTSRGGFLALHWLHRDDRVKAGIGFAPVTKLGALTEFTNAVISDPHDLQSYGESFNKPVRIWFGPDDARVRTDFGIELVKTAGLNADICVQVQPSIGHNTPKNAHREAAEWLLAQRKGR
jgi:dienelactone hydrolase